MTTQNQYSLLDAFRANWDVFPLEQRRALLRVTCVTRRMSATGRPTAAHNGAALLGRLHRAYVGSQAHGAVDALMDLLAQDG